MVKHVQGWDITKRIGNKRKVYVRQFSGSKADCMKDYMKPCIRENNPDHLIFHVGTKDVLSNKTAKCIAESILSLSKEVKASKLDVSVSSIILRNDNWNNKVMEVNSYLMDLCESNDISFINNATINPKRHLNSSRLNLNRKGSNKCRDKFVRYLKGLTSLEIFKRNWPEGCSRSEDNACSSSRVTKISNNEEFSPEHLSFLRKKHSNRVIIGHININSIRNKFDHLIAITKGNVDVLMISETKLDESVPFMQFNIDGYNIFRSDRMLKEVIF